ncbi:MAG: PadR family transcriptional regulator [Candidatus Cloacimonadaceae bacterium]
MSRIQMIVLGFLHETPMHAYRIGQMVESRKCPVWEGIKVASVYKAMQSLDQKGYIDGEQATEGNNPPRTVYHINDKGIRYLSKLVTKFLSRPDLPGHEFWMGLSFTRQLFTRKQMQKLLHARSQFLDKTIQCSYTEISDKLIAEHKLPIIHRHLVRLNEGWVQAELEVLQDFSEQMNKSEYDTFFKE